MLVRLQRTCRYLLTRVMRAMGQVPALKYRAVSRYAKGHPPIRPLILVPTFTSPYSVVAISSH